MTAIAIFASKWESPVVLDLPCCLTDQGENVNRTILQHVFGGVGGQANEESQSPKAKSRQKSGDCSFVIWGFSAFRAGNICVTGNLFLLSFHLIPSCAADVNDMRADVWSIPKMQF